MYSVNMLYHCVETKKTKLLNKRYHTNIIYIYLNVPSYSSLYFTIKDRKIDFLDKLYANDLKNIFFKVCRFFSNKNILFIIILNLFIVCVVIVV